MIDNRCAPPKDTKPDTNHTLDNPDGGFTDPNRRVIRLFLGKDEVARCSFDVVQKREYEG